MAAPVLGDRMAALREAASEQSRHLYDALVKHLKDSGALAGVLKGGETFPDFQLASAEGRLITRDHVLADGPAVFVFDRGAWCPYCAIAFGALEDAAPQIMATGAKLFAITPEAGGRTLRMKRERGLQFEILCDLDHVLAHQCGLAFPASDELRKAYLERGIDLENLYGNDAWMLPAPAAFVVRPDATIAYAHVDADFRYRLEPLEIVEILRRLV